MLQIHVWAIEFKVMQIYFEKYILMSLWTQIQHIFQYFPKQF